MKNYKKAVSIALSALMLTTAFAACGGNGDGGDVNLDDEGNVRPGASGQETKITFWGVGDENEVAVFTKLVQEFNTKYDGTIEVRYEHKTDGDYVEASNSALMATKAGVDILYVKEPEFKRYATLGFLEPLDSYLAKSEEVVVSEMWETSINRYKYDVDTTTQDGPNAHYWGIPKDIGPTALYYNETAFKEAGVKVISVAAEDLAKFNAGETDARGQKKSEIGLTDTVKEKGYFVDGNGQKWFNNQVPMSWDECVALANVVQTAMRQKEGNENFYGYFTEWWFNYGWSVGGDCIQYVETDDPAYNGGYYDFTLMDPTPNYIVADDNTDGFTVNGTTYQAGEIIEWADKLVDTKASQKTIRSEVLNAVSSGELNQLPSQREAFVEFVRAGQKTSEAVETGVYGYGISPTPSSIGGDTGKANAFASGKLGMLVDGRWSVVQYRNQIDWDWDVAPLPMYKEYDANGDITVHGVEAGHSGSVALCINAKSQKKNAAWIFAEYIGGRTGQTEQAKSGFAIPSQKDIANSEVFLQTNQKPKNSIVFVRAAEHQTPADWFYLYDKLWTDPWADLLNGTVRNGEMTLSEFEMDNKYTNTWNVLKTYTAKK